MDAARATLSAVLKRALAPGCGMSAVLKREYGVPCCPKFSSARMDGASVRERAWTPPRRAALAVRVLAGVRLPKHDAPDEDEAAVQQHRTVNVPRHIV
jgi:hypothetical protein